MHFCSALHLAALKSCEALTSSELTAEDHQDTCLFVPLGASAGWWLTGALVYVCKHYHIYTWVQTCYKPLNMMRCFNPNQFLSHTANSCCKSQPSCHYFCAARQPLPIAAQQFVTP